MRHTLVTTEKSPIVSLMQFYNNSNWLEREIWDLYGIYFIGHYDLRRILTDYNFAGHPLRKDFPLSGFVEIHYDDTEKSLLYKKISLSQEYRNFNFLVNWKK